MDWCERVCEFLDMCQSRSSSTYKSYRNGLKRFKEYYGKSLGSFLDKFIEDRRKRTPQHIGEKHLRRFVSFLENKNYSGNTIRTYVAAVQSLVRYTFRTTITTRYINLPNSEAESKKYEWNQEEIYELVQLVQGNQIEAIVTTLYQSGLSVSDLLSITWETIKKQYQNEVKPICIEGKRLKTGQPFITFFGNWAVDKLTQYLDTRPPLDKKDRLFTYSYRTIANKFKSVTHNFVENYEGATPCRPHSLRSAFSTHLTDAGMRGLFIEFFSGHSVNQDVRKRYQRRSKEKWREIYEQYEWAITPPQVREVYGVSKPVQL